MKMGLSLLIRIPLNHTIMRALTTFPQERIEVLIHCVPSDARFHPTNEGGTAKIYKKYKKQNSDILDDNYFPLMWEKK